jgi:hypothetical protein
MTKTIKPLAALGVVALILGVSTGHSQSGGQQITISSIVGLVNQLAIRPQMGASYATGTAAVIDEDGLLESADGNPSDCVHVDGSSGPCPIGTMIVAGTNIVDAAVPQGAVNGSNQQFTLASAPNPPTSLHVYLNGLRLSSGVDYAISGTVVTFMAASAPQAGDIILVDYRY